jgi:DNA invertase Pin-like site-specific DNA recombinase
MIRSDFNSGTSFLRDPLITQEHLRYDVIVYVRHSSQHQVEPNKGSTEFQRAQVDLARAYGWRQEQIVVIDDDLGRSGGSVDNRPGYQRIVELIGSGKVKAVIAADISRLSRNLVDVVTFLTLTAHQHAVLILDGRAVDPCDHSDIWKL